MIKPTIGRVVWYWPLSATVLKQPEAALISWVHSDGLVNLGTFDAYGISRGATSVPLYQGEGERPESGFCEWMPYQIGQAAKQESRVEPIKSARMADLTEAQQARVLANKILDRHSGDPDDDLAILSRQLLRADETLKAASHALRSYQFGNASTELTELIADRIDGLLGTVT